jgi:DNA-directed RNA polymerase specialized sigma subunit
MKKNNFINQISELKIGDLVEVTKEVKADLEEVADLATSFLRLQESQSKGGKVKNPKKGFGTHPTKAGRAKKWTKEKIAELQKLRDDGLTLREIGEKIGKSESFVSKLLKKS